MMDIHALIRTFLQQHSACLHFSEEKSEDILKAGIVPFIYQDVTRFYVLKPRAKHPGLGEPPFQLCKGTRMVHMLDGHWQDRIATDGRPQQQESLVETALREGIEELGLQLNNIRRLLDMGAYDFISATTGKCKHMWLFAAEVENPEYFLPAEAVAAFTQERAWLSAAQFEIVGRRDHRYSVQNIEKKLMQGKSLVSFAEKFKE